MRDGHDPDGLRLPIKLDATSNGEFAPIPLAAVHRRARALAHAAAGACARRLNLSRRRFLTSACGAAATLLAFNDAFAAAALEERREAQWPPFTRIAVLRAEAAGRAVPLDFLDQARDLAQACAVPGIELLGPAAAPMERRAGHYRAQLLVHGASHSQLQRLFARWLPQVEDLPAARKVRWSLDVDPLELF